MTTRLVLSVLLAMASGLAARAETDAGAAAGGTPTVTIINKSTEAKGEAKAPELEILPASGPAAAAPASASKTPPAPSGPPAASEPAAQTTAPSTPPPQTEAVADVPATAPPAEPTLAISIDLSRQSMTVSENGMTRYTWPVSSAAYGYRTPVGTFTPTWMAKMWYSRQYDNAPMPHAIFFHKGVAIHATYAVRSLGRPASHGCVRLAPKNAATLFKLVSHHGKERTQIVVHGQPDHSFGVAAANRPRRQGQRYLAPGYYAPRAYSAYAPPPGYYAPRQRRGAYAQQQRRYQPRGLYNSYSYGYGF
jgi:lipoprotein-anchoring transpeptidase ErfK/SrfK